MPSTPFAEQFVTLFDSSFLPQGLALASSLEKNDPGATLWVLCVDDMVRENLARLDPPNVRTIDTREIEDSRLTQAKRERSPREYCWTLTSFSFDAVFHRCPATRRVTYLDADLYFFGSAGPIFDELQASGKAVLVTEHNFDPRYDRSESVGRFCVQFLVMDRSSPARDVRLWWQDRVIEWCFDRHEPGRFGDQKYLDLWPDLFGDRIQILARKDLALAPWNVHMEAGKGDGVLRPAFYHFHSFRIAGEKQARLVEGGYAIPPAAKPLYAEYVSAIDQSIRRMRQAGMKIPLQPIPTRAFPRARHLVKKVLGRADLFARLAGAP